MNFYCQSALNQLRVAINSIEAMIDQLEEHELELKSQESKRSVRELLAHIALICKADYYISNGWSQQEMSHFYTSSRLYSIEEIKVAITSNFTFLVREMSQLNELELRQKKTSYWGATYSLYEWLLQMVAHVYHHRGQLHTMLVHCFDKDLKVNLFE